MATMTAAPAPNTASKIENLTHDVAALADKISRLKQRKMREETAFAALKVEEEKIGKRFAESGANPAAVQEIDHKLRAAGMALNGLKGMIAEHEQSYSGLFAELTRLQLAEQKERELQTIADLKIEALAIASRVGLTIRAALDPDLTRFVAIRAQLAKVMDAEFAKQGHRPWPISPAVAQSRVALKEAEARLKEVLRPVAKLIA